MRIKHVFEFYYYAGWLLFVYYIAHGCKVNRNSAYIKISCVYLIVQGANLGLCGTKWPIGGVGTSYSTSGAWSLELLCHIIINRTTVEKTM